MLELFPRPLHRSLLTSWILLFISGVACGQTASLRGQVVDQSGAVIPKAAVTLNAPSGLVKATTTAENGSYSFEGLPPGEYTVHAAAPKLEQEPVPIVLKPGTQALRLELRVAAVQQQTTIPESGNNSISTESANNASAVVLRSKDLESLADDPEDLGADLQALAGASAGPGGSSIFIDGFSGGQLPSKDSIREIRINQNPFSPEYDKLGYGRIEILTKPGADKLHGTEYYNFGDDAWNSRNPYAAQKAPFLLKEYGGSLQGPLSKLASLFLTVDRATIDNGAIINGTALDPNTLSIINPYTQVYRIPQRRIRVSPRVDYQLTPADTLSIRYAFSDADIEHSGVGGFNLVSSGIHNHGTDHTAQIANTLVIGANALNETRLQFYRAGISSISEATSGLSLGNN
jgi:Carboxypeptidase regulatory-like domain